MFSLTNVYSQDTVYVNDNSMSEISKYGARDSIFADLKKKQIHLFGNAFVETEGINLSAGYILVDLDKNELSATYLYDADSNRIEIPVFKDGAEEISAYTIKYNLDTQKAYIEEVKIQQDEMYLYMGEAKRHPNDHIHFKKGRFTTCNLPEPHYHFQLSKAVMVPEKRIATGPMNLWIAQVPSPLGLPFAIIPQQKERTHGFLFPEFQPISAYGMGVRNLGYFFPINNNWQTSAFISLFSGGSWGVKNATQYKKRYGFDGGFAVEFMQYRTNFPDRRSLNNLMIEWNHSQDQKSNPYWKFNSNVNFRSDNDSKNTLEGVNENYFKNTLASDINLNCYFPGKPFQMSGKLSLRQNSLSKTVSLLSPLINFNTQQIQPFRKKVGASQIVKRFGFRYSYEFKNESTFQDSLMRQVNTEAIGRQYFNGMKQNLSLQTTGSLFNNVLKLTPSLTYNTTLNFQQIGKSFDLSTNITSVDTLRQSGLAHDLKFRLSATSLLYSYYKFVGKRNPLLRHVLTPTIGFSYSPNLNPLNSYLSGTNQTEVKYSPFEQSIYRVGQTQDQATLDFNFMNTFELKRKSDSDTLDGFKKTKIFEAVSITGNYDFLKDSMQLSNISLSARTQPAKWINIVATGTFSPYSWIDSTGAIISKYALADRNKLGRLLNTNITTTLTLTSKESQAKIEENKNKVAQLWDADLSYFALHPEYLVDFDIPWKINFSHVLDIRKNTNRNEFNNEAENIIQTLMMNGDISFTKRWKLSGTISADVKEKKITNGFFTLTRDMHCWDLSFRWTPIGLNKSFLLTIRNTSSIFSSAKLDFRKPPAFF